MGHLSGLFESFDCSAASTMSEIVDRFVSPDELTSNRGHLLDQSSSFKFPHRLHSYSSSSAANHEVVGQDPHQGDMS